jgi:hypothetical protein
LFQGQNHKQPLLYSFGVLVGICDFWKLVIGMTLPTPVGGWCRNHHGSDLAWRRTSQTTLWLQRTGGLPPKAFPISEIYWWETLRLANPVLPEYLGYYIDVGGYREIIIMGHPHYLWDYVYYTYIIIPYIIIIPLLYTLLFGVIYDIDPWHIMGIVKLMGFRTLFFFRPWVYKKTCPHSREIPYTVHPTTSPYECMCPRPPTVIFDMWVPWMMTLGTPLENSVHFFKDDECCTQHICFCGFLRTFWECNANIKIICYSIVFKWFPKYTMVHTCYLTYTTWISFIHPGNYYVVVAQGVHIPNLSGFWTGLPLSP